MARWERGCKTRSCRRCGIADDAASIVEWCLLLGCGHGVVLGVAVIAGWWLSPSVVPSFSWPLWFGVGQCERGNSARTGLWGRFSMAATSTPWYWGQEQNTVVKMQHCVSRIEDKSLSFARTKRTGDKFSAWQNKKKRPRHFWAKKVGTKEGESEGHQIADEGSAAGNLRQQSAWVARCGRRNQAGNQQGWHCVSLCCPVAGPIRSLPPRYPLFHDARCCVVLFALPIERRASVRSFTTTACR